MKANSDIKKDVYEEVEYDGKIDRTTRMKESLYALFCH